MSPASRGLDPREGHECLLVKMGRTGPLVEPRRGPQPGKSGDPRSQDADNRLNKNTWRKFKGKTAGSSTTTRNAFQMRIKECKTKSLTRLLQEVHLLLRVKF